MFEQTFKNIDDVLWKEAGCTTELDYTEQTSWLLFLKYLDDLEQERALEAELVGKPYELSLIRRIGGRLGRLLKRLMGRWIMIMR
jgi:HsdM N-terminal domain